MECFFQEAAKLTKFTERNIFNFLKRRGGKEMAHLRKEIFINLLKICALCGFLFLSSSARADLKFYGGDMTGRIVIRPAQNLQINPAGDIIGIQGLAGGDLISLATTEMSGVVSNNQYLRRVVSGEIGKTILNRQVTAGSSNTAYRAAGIQNMGATITVKSSDLVDLRGNTGAIMFDSAGGADPSITFNTFDQRTTHAAPATGSMIAQMDNITAVIRSPGTSASNPMSLVATGDAGGRVAFASSIDVRTAKSQEHSASLAGSAGLCNGETVSKGFIIMESYTEMGTIE